MWVTIQNLDPISSAVFTFIEYQQTIRQTSKVYIISIDGFYNVNDKYNYQETVCIVDTSEEIGDTQQISNLKETLENPVIYSDLDRGEMNDVLLEFLWFSLFSPRTSSSEPELLIRNLNLKLIKGRYVNNYLFKCFYLSLIIIIFIFQLLLYFKIT